MIFTTQQIALSKRDIMARAIYQRNYIWGSYKAAHRPISRLMSLGRASARVSTALASQPDVLHEPKRQGE